jgi:type IV fimbrial biogenesis protein FimT
VRRGVQSVPGAVAIFLRELKDVRPAQPLILPAHRRMLRAMKQTQVFGSGVTRQDQQGVSLVELLVVVLIGGWLAALAVPSLGALVHAQRGSALASGLFASLQLARIAAITRNDRVVMCKSPDGGGCSTVGGWQQGWIVFHDRNNNAVRDAGETVIERHQAISTGWWLTGNGPVSNYVSYGSTGYSKLVSGAFQAGTFTLCPTADGSGEARQIVINSAGRARIQKAAATVCH